LGDEHCEEEFTSRKLQRKASKRVRPSVVQDLERFKAQVLSNPVQISGGEVREFVQCYSDKLGSYLGKPFLVILTDGLLLHGLKNFKKYVLGAAICKHYGFPPKRFIEVQFHYHNEWKNNAPTVHYVTSLHSEWNSVGRYKDYCDKYKTEIDYFGEGKDNVNTAYLCLPPLPKPRPLRSSLVEIYEGMISFQLETKLITRKEAIRLLGYPGRELVPFKYLKTLPLYLELVEEDAWGDSVVNIDSYRKLKIEIENTRYAG
jgi:hypothetical protein